MTHGQCFKSHSVNFHYFNLHIMIESKLDPKIKSFNTLTNIKDTRPRQEYE